MPTHNVKTCYCHATRLKSHPRKCRDSTQLKNYIKKTHDTPCKGSYEVSKELYMQVQKRNVNLRIFYQEISFSNIVRQISSPIFRPQCVQAKHSLSLCKHRHCYKNPQLLTNVCACNSKELTHSQPSHKYALYFSFCFIWILQQSTELPPFKCHLVTW